MSITVVKTISVHIAGQDLEVEERELRRLYNNLTKYFEEGTEQFNKQYQSSKIGEKSLNLVRETIIADKSDEYLSVDDIRLTLFNEHEKRLSREVISKAINKLENDNIVKTTRGKRRMLLVKSKNFSIEKKGEII